MHDQEESKKIDWFEVGMCTFVATTFILASYVVGVIVHPFAGIALGIGLLTQVKPLICDEDDDVFTPDGELRDDPG